MPNVYCTWKNREEGFIFERFSIEYGKIREAQSLISYDKMILQVYLVIKNHFKTKRLLQYNSPKKYSYTQNN